ncbi:hypothetical protein HG536_0H01370 [Torulaspora globosa]|uniref:Uncharacterized protein n=1 Tax=Torulaspora globosa TaxID=48254 RepID=A0A7G3ZMM6_9SACH|nr:uncharacterized protein HG536_0H01370 [Torulaspora globosa]QLL34762.1 hypothetical protein HG536_0H01370 [Torulaspora globosa]
MVHETLLRKQANVIRLLSTEEVQERISRPDNAAVAFTFPITCLLKSKKTQAASTSAQLYTYSLDEDGFKDWRADIAKPAGTSCEDEVELYWDMIMLTEGQFLLPAAGSDERREKRNLKRFQKYVVKRMGARLDQIVNSKKAPAAVETASWRKLGFRYTLAYLPLHFKDVIWCKSDDVYIHVILPETDLGSRRQTNEREWLLALLELASTMDMQRMRLYIRRDDLNGVSTFLRNLSWIGGKMVPNEDRNARIGATAAGGDDEIDEMLLGDEAFVILEFEC